MLSSGDKCGNHDTQYDYGTRQTPSSFLQKVRGLTSVSYTHLGRGFYDRLLSTLNAPKVGICFGFQMIPQVPVEPLDKKMDPEIQLLKVMMIDEPAILDQALSLIHI